jgi:hypothetical protein
MAKRRKTSSGGVRIIKVPAARAAAPIIRVSAPRAAPKKKHRRRHGGGGGGMTPNVLLGAAIGGAALGFVDKSFPTLPTIPLLGKPGTIAVIAYFLSKRGGLGGGLLPGGLMRDIAIAGAAIAGHELGLLGKISGDIAPQVSGVASQI